MDEAVREGRAARVREAVREGPDLPRQLHGQLGPGHALGDLGPRGRAAPRGGHALHRSTTRWSRARASITVATVRPETMLADTAIAVHPDDERYTRLIGEAAILPLVGRRLPIIADEYVKTDFGTGALKITPGHDPNDFEIGRKHGLEEISVIGEDGLMTAEAGEFAGLTAEDGARDVVAALREEGSISGTQPYAPRRAALAPLGRADRAADLAAVVLRHGEARGAGDRRGEGRVASLPSRAALDRGLPRLAREHPALVHLPPALVGPPDPGLVPRRGDPLRAWSRQRARAGSAIPTCSTPGSPPPCGPSRRSAGRTSRPQLRAFYPTDVLSTARDIIFLWVARMVMFGVEFTGELPFTDVPIHSVIQAPDGRRMSKSLGTGIDPLDEIDRHGADALRFGLLAMSSTQDVRFSEERVRAGARPGQQAVERLPPDPPRRPGGRRALGGAGRDGRGPLDPVPDGAHHRAHGRAGRGLRARTGGARAVRVLLVRAVRLVPRAGQAAALRRGGRPDGGLRHAAVLPRSHPAAAASRHAARDGGGVVLHAGRPRAAGGRRVAGRGGARHRRGGRGRAGPRHRGDHRAAPLPRAGRGEALGDPAGADERRRLRGDRRPGRAARAPGALGRR